MLKLTKTVDTIQEVYEGVTLEIARTNSDAYRSKSRRLWKPYKRQLENNSLTVQKERELLSEAMAGTLLVGWDDKQMQAALKQPYPFSVENAKALLAADDDLREAVLERSGNLELFLMQEEEELVGKSSKASSGS